MPEVTLGEIARERREVYQGDKSSCPVVGLEHLEPGEIRLSTWSVGGDNTFSKSFCSGDVLFGRRRAYLKKAVQAAFDGICSGDITVIQPIPDKVLPDLLPFIIQNDAFFSFAVENSAGSLSPRVKWEHLKHYKINLPPIEEQRKLADLLWAAYDLKESYKRLLAASDELAKSRFIEMFGDPVTNPRGWETRPLDKLGELNRGVSKARPRNSPDLLGGEYPLVQTGEVTNSDTYITDFEQTYSEKGLAQSKMWKAGTLCITIAANIAQTAILTFDACFPDSVVGFIANNKTRQLFIHYWFKFFQKVLEEQAPQVAQKNINLKILKGLLVIMPPLTLQDEFVGFIEQLDKSKIELQKCITALDDTVKKLFHNNLSLEERKDNV